MPKSIARRPGEGTAYWVLGGLYQVLVSGEETAGASTVMYMTTPEGAGPPPHTHPGSESVYVVSGTARFHVGDETHEAGPGSFFHFPAGTLETFEPTSTLETIVIYEPGGIDRFFAEVGEVAPALELPPPSQEPPDLARIAAIGEQYGMQLQVPG